MGFASPTLDSQSILSRYGIAVLTTGAAVWARQALHPWLLGECPFSLFYLSVLITAWWAGSGPAILAIALGTTSAAFLFIEPRINMRVDSLAEIIQAGIYVIVNCVATVLFYRLERQRSVAEQRAQENAHLSHSLRLADERKDEYLALLAHELRNPLAPIRTGLAMLKRNPESPGTVDRVRRVLERHTNHLVRLTHDLLDVSRISRGKIVLHKERMPLQEALDAAVEMIRDQIDEANHQFHVVAPPEPIWIEGDRVRVTQFIANLLGNAVKFTPPSGRISIELDQHDGQAMVVVRDSGIGFAPEQAERIFQPFTQIDASRTREQDGLGLGLSIVRTLVELHGGTVEAHSRGPSLGSCFCATLPCYPGEALNETASSSTAHAPRQNSRAGDTSAEPTPAPRILLVEDNADAADMLVALLSGDGFQVATAGDGLQALHVASTFQPDICLLDIGLPGMDGYEVARRIRRSPLGGGVRLIALTGWGSAVDQELTSAAGFDLHLVKPVVYEDLVQVLNEVPNGNPQTVYRDELVGSVNA